MQERHDRKLCIDYAIMHIERIKHVERWLILSRHFTGWYKALLAMLCSYVNLRSTRIRQINLVAIHRLAFDSLTVLSSVDCSMWNIIKYFYLPPIKSVRLSSHSTSLPMQTVNYKIVHKIFTMNCTRFKSSLIFIKNICLHTPVLCCIGCSV